jgi:hypothetical protein
LYVSGSAQMPERKVMPACLPESYQASCFYLERKQKGNAIICCTFLRNSLCLILLALLWLGVGNRLAYAQTYHWNVTVTSTGSTVWTTTANGIHILAGEQAFRLFRRAEETHWNNEIPRAQMTPSGNRRFLAAWLQLFTPDFEHPQAIIVTNDKQQPIFTHPTPELEAKRRYLLAWQQALKSANP